MVVAPPSEADSFPNMFAFAFKHHALCALAVGLSTPIGCGGRSELDDNASLGGLSNNYNMTGGSTDDLRSGGLGGALGIGGHNVNSRATGGMASAAGHTNMGGSTTTSSSSPNGGTIFAGDTSVGGISGTTNPADGGMGAYGGILSTGGLNGTGGAAVPKLVATKVSAGGNFTCAVLFDGSGDFSFKLCNTIGLRVAHLLPVTNHGESHT